VVLMRKADFSIVISNLLRFFYMCITVAQIYGAVASVFWCCKRIKNGRAIANPLAPPYKLEQPYFFYGPGNNKFLSAASERECKNKIYLSRRSIDRPVCHLKFASVPAKQIDWKNEMYWESVCVHGVFARRTNGLLIRPGRVPKNIRHDAHKKAG
jgi:hypothetical protein